MNAPARLSVALLAALVLWWPTMAATLRGDVDLLHGALRYVAAFLFARLAIGALARLVDGYSKAGVEVRPDEQDDPAAAPQRRRSDGRQTSVGAS